MIVQLDLVNEIREAYVDDKRIYLWIDEHGDYYTTLHIYSSKLQSNSSNINLLIKLGVGRLYSLMCEYARSTILNLYSGEFELIHMEIIYG